MIVSLGYLASRPILAVTEMESMRVCPAAVVGTSQNVMLTEATMDLVRQAITRLQILQMGILLRA